MNSVCALFYLFYRVFPRAKSEHTSRRGFIKFEIAAVGGHPLGGLEEIVWDGVSNRWARRTGGPSKRHRCFLVDSAGEHEKLFLWLQRALGVLSGCIGGTRV